MKHPGGRPRLLSAELCAQIAELRRLGMGYGSIAARVGVGRTTVRRALGTDGLSKSEGALRQNLQDSPESVRTDKETSGTRTRPNRHAKTPKQGETGAVA